MSHLQAYIFVDWEKSGFSALDHSWFDGCIGRLDITWPTPETSDNLVQ